MGVGMVNALRFLNKNSKMKKIKNVRHILKADVCSTCLPSISTITLHKKCEDAEDVVSSCSARSTQMLEWGLKSIGKVESGKKDVVLFRLAQTGAFNDPVNPHSILNSSIKKVAALLQHLTSTEHVIFHNPTKAVRRTSLLEKFKRADEDLRDCSEDGIRD